MFFGEVSATFPEFSDEDCSTWDIVDGLLKSRISILDEYIAEETSQAEEYTKLKEELDESIKEVYPCQNPFECSIISEGYSGDKKRNICNIITDDSAENDEEDCRYEMVRDPTKGDEEEGNT